MKQLLSKKKYIKILENFKISTNDIIWIHHPITNDLIQVIVKKSQINTVLVSISKDSPYIGQPDFVIKKTSIIGLK